MNQPSTNVSAPPRKKRRKGPRPKHIPQRTCISCRETAAKRTLTRVVRTPEGTVEIDPTGKKNGRGAYLCDRRSCWERAISTPLLARALKTEITPETIDALRRHAATLTGDETSPAADAAGAGEPST